jgi:adenylate cyclase
VSDEGAKDLRHRLRTSLNHIVGYCELLIEVVEERGLADLLPELRKIRIASADVANGLDELVVPARRPPVEPGTGRLLVVDDDADNREIAARFLERAGYTVERAGDGAAALAAVAERAPDLVLLDVMMPGLDGIEVCRRLKQDPDTRLIPVVIMTGLAHLDDRIRGIQAGADDYLTKPVDRAELLARIKTSLRLKDAVDEKLRGLRGTRDYLARFVPRALQQRLAEHPDGPVPERVETELSALFVDITGYVRLCEKLGHRADLLVERYFSAFLDAIHLHGGDVTETSGDGMMVVFAGNEGRSLTAELNAGRDGGIEPIAVHIGVNSGWGRIGPVKYEGQSGARWIYTASGPAVNLAARIGVVAEAGSIVVGSDTARRVDGAYVVEELPPRGLKNVSGEVRMSRVLGRKVAAR